MTFDFRSPYFLFTFPSCRTQPFFFCSRQREPRVPLPADKFLWRSRDEKLDEQKGRSDGFRVRSDCRGPAMSLVAGRPTSVVFSSYPRGSRSGGSRYSKNSPMNRATVLLLLLLLILLRSVPSSSETPFGSQRTVRPLSLLLSIANRSLPVGLSRFERVQTDEPNEVGATLRSRHCLSEQTAWSCLRAK